MLHEVILEYLETEGTKFISWSKCGESTISMVPTVLWAAAATVLAHRTLSALFRRTLFRRVQAWELMLQHLLFLWMVIYSLHLWSTLVQLTKLLVVYCYLDDNGRIPEEIVSSVELLQQVIIWVFATMPIIYYIWTRRKPDIPPLMIWITNNPWQRRELGPYEYYLSRPPAPLRSLTDVSIQQHFYRMRRVVSDSRIVVRETQRKKRYSKSV